MHYVPNSKNNHITTVEPRQNIDPPSLINAPEDERARALERFQAIRPFLEEGVPVAQLARHQGIPLRTAWRWIEHYRRDGLAGLARKQRHDKNQRKVSTALKQVIEGLALRKPRLSAASIHRKAIEAAEDLGERPPSYGVVYSMICELEPALLTMAHEGTKVYSESFDLIHRTEATAPNADLAGRPHRARHPGEGRERHSPPAVADHHPRRLQPRGRGVSAVLLRPVGDPDGPGPPPGDLAKGRSRAGMSAASRRCSIPTMAAISRRSISSRWRPTSRSGLIFSAVGRPRGRGKIERFFESLSQVSSRGCPATPARGQAEPPC